jgi:tRNA U34 5-carboxymethylaminomethyl modifying enzyme MnmG/GidA
MAAYRVGVKADNARTRITKVSMNISYEMGLVQHYFG